MPRPDPPSPAARPAAPVPPQAAAAEPPCAPASLAAQAPQQRLQPPALRFATAVSDPAVLAQRLLASPDLRPGGAPLLAVFNAASAAQALAQALAGAAPAEWVVWVHQDVFLPAGWAARFAAALAQVLQRDPRAAVAGVYGVAGHGAALRRAGGVLDRGHPLREPAPLPCPVDSLDELLVAVRAGSGLGFEPALGFDFYGTDIVLQAQERGLTAWVVDAWCEHWSSTPRSGPLPPALAARLAASGAAFEARWARRLPVATSWLECRAPGDVARALAAAQGGAPPGATGPGSAADTAAAPVPAPPPQAGPAPARRAEPAA